MFSFFGYIWENYKSYMGRKKVEKTRDQLLKRVMSGEDSAELVQAWARLEHEERMLNNPEYRRMDEEIRRLNKGRLKRKQ